MTYKNVAQFQTLKFSISFVRIVTVLTLIIISASISYPSKKFNDCWWSGCQPLSWIYRGCYPEDKYYVVKSIPCVDPIMDSRFKTSGHSFFCCAKEPNYEDQEIDNSLEEQEVGICSFYGGSDIPQGSPTASGQKFDQFAMTAAHKTLPFGTRIRVKHMKTNGTVDVTINDRGPFIRGRILDLSFAAFGILEDHDKGLFRCSYAIQPSF